MTYTNPPPPPPNGPVLSLSQQAAPYLAQGYFVKLQDKNMMILEKPAKEINHVLHLGLTVITCGTWSIIWIALAIFHKDTKTITLYGA